MLYYDILVDKIIATVGSVSMCKKSELSSICNVFITRLENPAAYMSLSADGTRINMDAVKKHEAAREIIANIYNILFQEKITAADIMMDYC